MLAPNVIDEVRRLLAEGRLSQRKIAERLGVHRNTVRAIANGKRLDRDSAHRGERPSGLPERCPGCGAKVYLPCRLCATRAALAAGLVRGGLRAMPDPIEPVGVQLRGEHRQRYEEVLARKLRRRSTMLPLVPLDASIGDEDEFELDPDVVLDAFELEDQPPY